MKTLKKVEIEPIYVEFIPEILEENKVYISEEYGTSTHSCLCGCGNKVIMPIDNIINGHDYGWKLIKENNGTVSFTPSVGNYQIPCKSHYIITKNVANFV
jgi:hypothetical protein